jgi:hypothetical protein
MDRVHDGCEMIDDIKQQALEGAHEYFYTTIRA